MVYVGDLVIGVGCFVFYLLLCDVVCGDEKVFFGECFGDYFGDVFWFFDVVSGVFGLVVVGVVEYWCVYVEWC